MAAIAAAGLFPLAGCVGSLGGGDDDSPYEDLHLESGLWATYVAGGRPEPDVFIETAGATGVWRPTHDDLADPKTERARLFTSSKTQAHDPSFGVVGPFPKGQAIPATLAEWSRATGSWAYGCESGQPGIFQGSFDGLVHEGLYTLWIERVRLNGGDLEASTWAPLGSGITNAFWTDKAGSATVRVHLLACLPASVLTNEVTGGATNIVAVYHSDGQTYGEFPGAFGKNAHTHVTTRLQGGPV